MSKGSDNPKVSSFNPKTPSVPTASKRPEYTGVKDPGTTIASKARATTTPAAETR